MKIFRTLNDWRDERRRWHSQNIGFVPTMGALHAGHLSLVAKARQENPRVAVSLFVNPTQFDAPDDLANYPRDTENDLRLLKAAGVDAVLMPDAEQLYPDDYAYQIREKVFSRDLCGQHRPGHFDGVLTVVMKLLNLVQPHRAYFGEKDYQQLVLIQGMVQAFFLPYEIIGCPIVREADGLAMSSRNRRLNPQQRQIAARLYAILSSADSVDTAWKQLQEIFDGVDYVRDWQGRRLAAVRLGPVRLIDNVVLPASDNNGARP